MVKNIWIIILIVAGVLHFPGECYATGYLSITPANRTLCMPGEKIPGNRVNTSEIVDQLRTKMMDNGLDAYLVPYEDQHISAPADHDQRLKYVSGFSGSNGYAWIIRVNGQNRQAVWTDGRYFLQADQEMDCEWILMKMSTNGYPTATEWLLEILPDGSTVGMDPKLVSISTWKNYEERLTSGKNFQLKAIGNNELVDQIWTEDRPAKPNNPLMIHGIEFAGRNWTDKISDVREKLMQNEADILFISALDETAWLFNLRGYDRDTSPYFFSYAVVTQNEIRLYIINATKLLTQEIQQHLNTGPDGSCRNEMDKYCVNVQEYDQAITDLRNFQNMASIKTIWVPPTSNHAIYEASGNKTFEEYSPIQLMKSVKNAVERKRYYECQVRDSAYLVEFVADLEQKIINGDTVTELSASDMLREIRSKDQYFRMVSFHSISAVGANGAVIHYRPTEETNTLITRNEMYLLDSGGNYLDGTTDVTRTFHFGTPTAQEKEAYTRVLIGCIELATAVWPQGKYGYHIESLARVKLWQHGWDYNHGTGHGIGYFLNVHEGPARISSATSAGLSPLYEGMFFSDEPGYYEDGKFGVRLETIVGVEKIDTLYRFNDVDYLGFRPATLVPFEPKLINYDMLNADQRKWLNSYNQRCRDETGKLLQQTGKTAAYNWLYSRTEHFNDEPIWELPNPVSSATSFYKENQLLSFTFSLLAFFAIIKKLV